MNLADQLTMRLTNYLTELPPLEQVIDNSPLTVPPDTLVVDAIAFSWLLYKFDKYLSVIVIEIIKG